MVKYVIRQEGNKDDGMWFDTLEEAIEQAKKECYLDDPYEIFECKLVGTVAVPEPDAEFFPCDDQN